MTKLKKRKLWIPILIIILITLGISFFSQTNSARAMLGNTHTANVLIRFINEIVLKSPAGQYYIDLSWKHTDDLNRIYINTPEYIEHREKLIYIIQIFTPGMEALLDGKGDTVQITREQINLLQTELDWLALIAGQPLREDIEKELQRFPLDNFVGMTMSEALDYVNSTWISDQPSVTPTISTSTLPPTPSIPICLVGSDSDCLEKPALVPNSNGLWAYYILNGVYFEYPSNWKLQQDQGSQSHMEHLFIVFQSDSPKGTNLLTLHLYIGKIPLGDINENDVLNFPETLLQRSTPIWKRPVSLTDFQGVEFLYKQGTGYFETFFFNEKDQMVVDVMAIFKDDEITELADNPDAIGEKLPNIQHIIESIRMAEPLATPIATSTAVPGCVTSNLNCLEGPTLVPDSNGLWGSYIYKGIYFEYPNDWQVQYLSYPQIDGFTIFQESESPDEGNIIKLLNFTFLDLQNVPIENWDQSVPFLLSQRGCTDTQWQIVHISEFQGFECFWKYPNSPTGTFTFFFYNENQRLGIELKANVVDKRLLETTNSLDTINKMFPSLGHIIQSIQILEPQ